MIKKRNVGEQWILLKGRGAAAADLHIDQGIVEFNGYIANIYSFARAAGVTGSMVLDVNKNGTTIFANATKITYTSAASPNAYDVLASGAQSVSKGDVLSLDIDSINSGTAAEAPVVMIQIVQRPSPGTVTNLAPSALR